MTHFTKSPSTFLLLVICIHAIGGTFAQRANTPAGNEINSNLWQNSPPRFELNFDFPDPVNEGEQFLFTVQIKKSASYQVSGTLKCRFFGGLSPKETILDAAEYTLENQTAIIHWESLSNSNIISFSIPAVSSQVPAGVYPVNISYEDENGFSLGNSVGIYVINKSEKLLPYIKPEQEASPFSIRLQYPGEISFDEKYNLKIILGKGKYTGGLELFVKLPPGSKIDIHDMDDYRYLREEGHLFLTMKNLPAGPEFVISCTVLNTNNTKSVYLVTAKAKLDNKITVHFKQPLFVSEQGETPITSLVDETLNPALVSDFADTTDKFAELDQLLNAWKESTSASAKPDEKTNKEDIPSEIQANGKTFFTVQIIASEIKLNDVQSRLSALHVNDSAWMDWDGTIYRYYISELQSHAEARKLANYLSSQGFEGAFVVKFVDGEKATSYY